LSAIDQDQTRPPDGAAVSAFGAARRPAFGLSPALTRALDAAAWLVLIGLAVVACRTFEDYGLGWDDYTHSQYADLLLDFYRSGFSDRRALSFVNLYMYGGGFDMAAALVAKLLPFDLFETRRLMGAAVGLVGLFIVWRLARRLGGPLAGLIALLLLAACPLFYGHMFINPKDAPFAVAMTLLLYGLARALEDYPRPDAATLVLVGLGLGLSVGTRIIGGMAALYMLPPLALLVWRDASAQGGRAAAAGFGGFVLRLLPALVLAYAAMALVWPWSVIEPLNPLRAVGYFSHFFEKPWKEMFGGALIAVPDMPRSYLPTYFAMKLPEVLSVLGLAGLAGALAASVRGARPAGRRAALLLVAMAVAVPVAITVATRPAMYNGVRHFIFILPPLAVLGGLAGGYVLTALMRRTRAGAFAAALAMLAGLSVPLVDMVRLHPYQYAYFNRASGGVRAADAGYMLDYWGLSFKQAADALLEKLEQADATRPQGRRWVIAVCGPHAPAEVELGGDFRATWDPKGADFALMLGEFYCAELDAPEIARIEREGVVFARVYDIRGRSIPTLFTIPPVTR
jgi:4-amino-4-deoxy-L-arabinose transferase-like glycosyltransferase